MPQALPPPRQPSSRRRLWVAGTVLTAFAAIATAAFMLRSPSAEAQPAAAPAATPVSVSVVTASPVATWDEFSGRLEAIERVDIRSRVAGAVQSVHFREGALVKKGDLLITIDPAPFAAEVERATAQVVSAQARQAFSRSEFKRADVLLGEEAIAQREHDASNNAMREADAALRAAQAALLSAKLNLGYTQVRAPVAGRVGRLEITVGNLVGSGPTASVLTTLVSVSPIYASFDADEQIVTRALREINEPKANETKAGASRDGDSRARIDRIPVEMELQSAAAPSAAASGATGTGAPMRRGHLQLIDNQVDARSGTVRVRAVFDNADGTLIPGQFAKLRMGQPQTSASLLINERAVGTDQSKKYVLVVGADNKAVYREVTLGASVNGLRIVTSGLQANERIIVNGLQRVRPGALVAPQAVPMDAKTELAAARAPS